MNVMMMLCLVVAWLLPLHDAWGDWGEELHGPVLLMPIAAATQTHRLAPRQEMVVWQPPVQHDRFPRCLPYDRAPQTQHRPSCLSTTCVLSTFPQDHLVVVISAANICIINVTHHVTTTSVLIEYNKEEGWYNASGVVSRGGTYVSTREQSLIDMVHHARPYNFKRCETKQQQH